MPTVRCPACLRALNVPEGALAEMVRCPLCERAFEVSRGEEDVGAGGDPVAKPSLITDSAPQPVPKGPPSAGATSLGELDPDTSRSLASASRWLKAMVLLQLLQAASCVACFRGGSASRADVPLALACPALFRIFTIPFVYAACHEGFDRRCYPRIVQAAALVALIDSAITLLAVFHTLFDILALLEQPGSARAPSSPPCHSS